VPLLQQHMLVVLQDLVDDGLTRPQLRCRRLPQRFSVQPPLAPRISPPLDTSTLIRGTARARHAHSEGLRVHDELANAENHTVAISQPISQKEDERQCVRDCETCHARQVKRPYWHPVDYPVEII